MNVLYISVLLIYTINAKCIANSIGDCMSECNCGLCITGGNIECIRITDKCEGCFSHYNYSCQEEDNVLELITWIFIMLIGIGTCIGVTLVIIERAFSQNRCFDVENV